MCVATIAPDTLPRAWEDVDYVSDVCCTSIRTQEHIEIQEIKKNLDSIIIQDMHTVFTKPWIKLQY